MSWGWLCALISDFSLTHPPRLTKTNRPNRRQVAILVEFGQSTYANEASHLSLFIENCFKICWICKVIVSGRRYTLGGLLWQLECRIADGAHVQCPSVPGSRWSAIRLLTHVPYVTKAKCHPLFMKADKPRTFFYSPEFFHEMKTTNEICSFRVNLGTLKIHFSVLYSLM